MDARNKAVLALAGLAGLLVGGFLFADRSPAPPRPPSVATEQGTGRKNPALAAAGEVSEADLPHARGEPVVADREAEAAAPVLPVDCPLPTGPDAPTSLRISWRSIRLGDPALSQAELDARIRSRARTLTRTGQEWELTLPAQADLLLILDAGKVIDAIALVWSDQGARCMPRPEGLRVVAVEGRVAGVEAGDRVTVFVCGDWVDVDAQGRFQATAPAGRDCLVFASRQDGMLSAIGGMVDVELQGGAAVLDLELDLPDYEMAGVGAALTPMEGGVEVLQAVPGGSAEAAGLASGDLITHVEGEPIDGWDLAEVVASITGPEGSTVLLTVEDAGGDSRELELVRSPIPAADDDPPEDEP